MPTTDLNGLEKFIYRESYKTIGIKFLLCSLLDPGKGYMGNIDIILATSLKG